MTTINSANGSEILINVPDPVLSGLAGAAIVTVAVLLLFLVLRRRGSQPVIVDGTLAPEVPPLSSALRQRFEGWHRRANGLPTTPPLNQTVSSLDYLLQKVAGLAAPPTTDPAREAAANYAVIQASAELNALADADPARFGMYKDKGHLSIEPRFCTLILDEGRSAGREKVLADEERQHWEGLYNTAESRRKELANQVEELTKANDTLRTVNLGLSNEIAKHNTDLTTHHTANFRDVATTVKSQSLASDEVIDIKVRQRHEQCLAELEVNKSCYERVKKAFTEYFVLTYPVLSNKPSVAKYMREYNVASHPEVQEASVLASKVERAPERAPRKKAGG